MSELAPQPVDSITEQEVDDLAWRELAPAARFLARARVFIIPTLLSLVALVCALDPAPWRIWLLGTVGALGLGVAVRDFIWLRRRTLRPKDVPYLLTLVVTMQGMAIAITGGVESPILPILIPVALLPAIVLGSRRTYLHFVALPLSVIWFFTVAGVAGWLPELTPRFFGPGIDFAANALYSVTRATVYTAAVVIGGIVAMLLRRGFRRGARAAAAARLELLESTRLQNQDLMALSSEIAHELKNPLASIQGLATLLARRLPEGSREAEQMGVLLSEVRRMGSTLEEFLTFSRPVRALAVADVPAERLVSEVAAMHEGLAHRRGVRLRQGPGAGANLRCDPRKVTQVLVNLTQNALEATPEGGEVILSAVPAEAEGVVFTVEDTGPGIDPSVAGRLFRPGVTTKAEGSGLGLVIARAIAEQHGGRLHLENRAEGGCRATLWLPARPPLPADPEVPGSPARGPEAAAPNPDSLEDAP